MRTAERATRGGCTVSESNISQVIEGLYRRHHGPLVGYLNRMTRCRSRAEDLAQLTWVKLLGALRREAVPAADEAGLRAYLYAVARNTFLDECTRKHESIRARPVDPADLDALIAQSRISPGPEDDLQRSQSAAVLRRALEGLPSEQRAVILMWCAGTSIRAMAARSAAPPDTVLSRKKYALAHLRGRLAALACAL